jgi:hypothetical protein
MELEISGVTILFRRFFRLWLWLIVVLLHLRRFETVKVELGGSHPFG